MYSTCGNSQLYWSPFFEEESWKKYELFVKKRRYIRPRRVFPSKKGVIVNIWFLDFKGYTLSPIIMEMKNCPKWKGSSSGRHPIFHHFPLNHSGRRSNFTTQTIFGALHPKKLNPQKPQKLEPRNMSVGWFTKKNWSLETSRSFSSRFHQKIWTTSIFEGLGNSALPSEVSWCAPQSLGRKGDPFLFV